MRSTAARPSLSAIAAYRSFTSVTSCLCWPSIPVCCTLYSGFHGKRAFLVDIMSTLSVRFLSFRRSFWYEGYPWSPLLAATAEVGRSTARALALRLGRDWGKRLVSQAYSRAGVAKSELDGCPDSVVPARRIDK